MDYDREARESMKRERMSMEERRSTVQLWLVADGRSGAVVLLRSERKVAPMHTLQHIITSNMMTTFDYARCVIVRPLSPIS